MGPLLVLLFALPAVAQTFDDKGVVVTYAPENLWRDPNGAFLGGRTGGKILLTYAFFDAEGYSSCPTKGGQDVPSPCEAAQRAVGDAFDLWAGAAGNLVVREAGQGERVNVWVAWTTAFRPGATVAGGKSIGPRGRSVDNTRAADSEDEEETGSGGGLDRPRRPGRRKQYGALLFNDKLCWYVDDRSVCPPPKEVVGKKKVVDGARALRETALHEGGHVLGFGHFTVDSIMGMAGGTGRYELTALDREAIRRLYDRVGR